MTAALKLKIRYLPIDDLKAYENNSRKHSKKQIRQIAASITRFGMVTPILITADGTIIAGHGKWMAARECGMTEVPTICIDHMNEADRKAYIIADNRLAELSSWDEDILRIELQNLEALDLDYPLEITGFDSAKIDFILGEPEPKMDPADEVPAVEETAITRPGDIFTMGDHRLICADARDPHAYVQLIDGEQARMSDPPYTVPIEGHVSGLGEHTHREFVAGAGELSDPDFIDLLAIPMAEVAKHSVDGSIHFWAMDWRHIDQMSEARKRAGFDMKNLVVWNKTNAGMGAFYRSQHELFFVFKKGKARHLNNFGLGETGRYRTNVWTYAGVNTFKRNRDEELDAHPTVKPAVMIADAIKDVSKRGDIVIDCFAGSGTTAIAAERTRRRARLIEMDPLYCDTIIRRFMKFAEKPVIHVQSGMTFNELAMERASKPEA